MSFRSLALCLAGAVIAVTAPPSHAQRAPRLVGLSAAAPTATGAAWAPPPEGWARLTSGRVLAGRLHLHAGPSPWVSVDDRRIGLDSLDAFQFQDGTFRVARQPDVPFPVPVKLVEEGDVSRFSTDLSRRGAAGERSSVSTLVAAAPLDMTFVQVAGGDLLPEEYGVLRLHLRNSAPAAPHLRRYRRLGTLGRIGFGLGSAIVLGGVGVAVADVDAGVPAPLIVSSGIVAGVLSAFVVPHLRQGALRRAVRAHNEAHR